MELPYAVCRHRAAFGFSVRSFRAYYDCKSMPGEEER